LFIEWNVICFWLYTACLFFVSSIKLVIKQQEITNNMCDTVNHTRFPKDDHLPDWVCRDKHGNKGDRVDYWLMYGPPEDYLWKNETCWWCNVLIIKAHINIVYLVCYNTVYEIMHRMNGNNKKCVTGEKFTNFRNPILYKFKI
jgi:hypothetical protein